MKYYKNYCFRCAKQRESGDPWMTSFSSAMKEKNATQTVVKEDVTDLMGC